MNFLENDMVSFNISFALSDYFGQATSWIVLQTGDFDEDDMTNIGYINNQNHFDNPSEMLSNSTFVNENGIKGLYPNDNEGFPIFGQNSS